MMTIEYLIKLQNIALGWLIWHRSMESMYYESRMYDLADEHEKLANDWDDTLAGIQEQVDVLTP